MTGPERAALRTQIDHMRRLQVARPLEDYSTLPTVEQARKMNRWERCPVHKELVGFDAFGPVGRCQGCMTEAAQAMAAIDIYTFDVTT